MDHRGLPSGQVQAKPGKGTGNSDLCLVGAIRRADQKSAVDDIGGPDRVEESLPAVDRWAGLTVGWGGRRRGNGGVREHQASSRAEPGGRHQKQPGGEAGSAFGGELAPHLPAKRVL